MSDPKRILIKIEPDWSYNFIGSIKDLIVLSPEVLAQYYTLACNYMMIRHNFVMGFMTNTDYTDQYYLLFKPLEGNSLVDATAKFCVENLYRRCRPVLEHHCKQVIGVNFINDEKGDVLGLVFHYAENHQITSLQFI